MRIFYSSQTLPPESYHADDPRARLIRHQTDEHPDIDMGEIRIALEQIRNNKAPVVDGITSELFRAR